MSLKWATYLEYRHTKHKEGKRKMSDNIAYLTTKEAAELSGFTIRHIQNMVKNGIMSATKDEKGNYVIQKCEFYRCFPEAHNKGNEAKEEEPFARMVLETEIKYLREIVDEKNKQNEFLHNQLELATTEKSLILQTLSSNTKLLVHKSETISLMNKKKKFLIF